MTFRANALAMLTGTVLAQVIPLLVAPLLTRLYAPGAFGLQTLFMSLAAGLAVLATCRLDLAVVLPDSEDEARQVGALVLCLVAVVVGTSLMVAVTAAPELARRLGYPDQTVWIWLLPLAVASIALTQLSVAFATRQQRFPTIAKANVANQAGFALGALAIGLLGAWSEGLAVAKFLGQVLGLSVVVFGCALMPSLIPSVCSWRAMRDVGDKYRQFLIFNTPYSLLGSLARDVPVYLFSATSSVAAAGYFALARTVLLAPTLVTSNALSQVFYREAVASQGSGRLEQLTMHLLRLGLLAGAPLFAFVAVWGDVVFVVLFGAPWRQAGVFAMMMAPAAWMSIQTGWPERLFEVRMRQGVSFSIQVASDVTTASLFAVTLLAGGGVELAVGVFAVANVIYHSVYLSAIFCVSVFSTARLASLLARGWAWFVLLCLVLGGWRLIIGAGLVSAMAAMLAAGSLALATALRHWRRGIPAEVKEG